MAQTGISDPLRRFIASHIHSVEQVEVLLLLKRTTGKDWSAEQVSRELASNPHAIESRLLDLHARGLVSYHEEAGSLVYRYEPLPELAPIVDELVATYAERRISVITLIFAKQPDSIQGFADAFRIKPRKQEDP